jgi:hypothetical protein
VTLQNVLLVSFCFQLTMQAPLFTQGLMMLQVLAFS